MEKITNLSRLVLSLMLAVLAVGCSTVSKIAYLRDLPAETPVQLQETRDLTLKPGDRLQVFVFSHDRELASDFNLWEGGVYGSNSYTSGNNISGRGGNHPYTVDENGEIEMPVLGRIKVGGKTRLEVADLIKYRLLSGEMLADPTVLVEYFDLSFYALGEIGHTGRITIPRDNVTLMEAISLAGDLTISGRRDNVMVLRTENGTQTPYYVNLTDPQSVYNSPVYYLQQNDMIYVEPTALRANQSTLMANQTRNPTFWMSTITSVITFYLFIRTFITNETSKTTN
ncbi:MAG: polysaccharide biosynthesis/export family protein [Bacteroidales bacterium]|nr:polysaccharide biosynthesis/export family protein [Bacteroidales bacterium]